jgi:hypothetical protein
MMKFKNSKLFLSFIIMLSSIRICFSQSDSLKFLSNKAWNASRWYLIAEMKANSLDFKNSRSSYKVSFSSRCNYSDPKTEFIREEKSMDLEVLRSGSWLLIEIQPVYVVDTLTLQIKDNERCKVKVPLSYTFQGGDSGMQPYLFLSQGNTTYFSKKFVIESPPAQDRADVQVDLLLGYTMASLKNTESGAKKSLHLAPVALTRGEWVSPWSAQRIGATISLEQSLGTYGGVSNQTLNISEISTGLFWEKILAKMKGVQFRLYLRYLQRLEEDGSFVTSIAPSHEYMVFPLMGTMVNFFFSDRWMSGFELAYGYPTQIAGAGVDQDMILLRARLGRRLTSSLFFLLETSVKQIHAGGTSADLYYNISSGFRLDL